MTDKTTKTVAFILSAIIIFCLGGLFGPKPSVAISNNSGVYVGIYNPQGNIIYHEVAYADLDYQNGVLFFTDSKSGHSFIVETHNFQITSGDHQDEIFIKSSK